MKSPNYPGIHSTEREPRSSGPAAPRLNGFWRSVALVSALATGAAACGPESRHEIGEEGKPDAGAITAPDSGTEPVQDAGGPVFVDAGTDAGTEADAGVAQDAGDVDAGSSVADAGTDAGATPLPDDDDGDGIPNEDDVCRQRPDLIGSDGLPLNTDGDALPNACDPCPARAPQAGEDPAADTDGDGHGNGCDNAPNTPNYTQADRDLDGVGDIADNSPEFNPEQTDADNDGYGAGWDCDDGDRAVHPGAVEEPCAPVDRNCDGRGGLLRQNPDGSAIFNGEPECSCVPGTVRPIGRTVVGSPCVAGQETCVVRGEISGYEMTTVPEGNTNTPETCNGVDDNCSGEADEGCGCNPLADLPRDCGPEEIGKCIPGTQTCIAGTWGPCENAVEADEEEVCNGVDDDCNDEIDDGIFGGAGGIPGQGKRGRGACGLDDATTDGVDEGRGIVECDGPNATKVSVNPGGSADRSLDYDACNGEDDDCDGRIDEENYSGAGPKGEACSLPGRCGPGVTVCVSDRATGCNSDVRRGTLNPADLESAAGLCNGVDDDCEGTVDDGCVCDPGETQVCGTNVGLCNQGVVTCNANGVFAGACGGPDFVGPATEVCNGEDDDCDGLTDEFANGRAGQACRGERLSRCDVNGTLVCDTENGGLRCTADDMAVPETCNGLDDDCNGVVDNGLGVGTDCEGVGDCGAGKVECRADGTTGCSTDVGGSHSQATPEMCNDLDDDCDGTPDEGCRTCAPGATQDCGTDVGACEFGTQTCDVNGAWGTTCVGGVVAQAELCNGLNDNCNNGAIAIDETFTTLGDVCDGKGACGAGTIQCKEDGSGVVCSTDIGGSNPGDTTERCNGVDEDCDGVIDDGIGTLGLPGTVCVLPGRCADGLVECAGVNSLATQCSSISLRIAETCNGVDDNCNTVVDDNYDVGGACNLPGICSTGVKRCMADGTNTECSSKDKAVAEVCNGLDDDCDNLTDEAFSTGGVRVGGRCTLSGCGAGTVRCKDDANAECSSIDRQVPEVAANLIDDDCDGSTDE